MSFGGVASAQPSWSIRSKPSSLDRFPIPSTAKLIKTGTHTYSLRFGPRLSATDVSTWYGLLWKLKGAKAGVWTACEASTPIPSAGGGPEHGLRVDARQHGA